MPPDNGSVEGGATAAHVHYFYFCHMPPTGLLFSQKFPKLLDMALPLSM